MLLESSQPGCPKKLAAAHISVVLGPKQSPVVKQLRRDNNTFGDDFDSTFFFGVDESVKEDAHAT